VSELVHGGVNELTSPSLHSVEIINEEQTNIIIMTKELFDQLCLEIYATNDLSKLVKNLN